MTRINRIIVSMILATSAIFGGMVATAPSASADLTGYWQIRSTSAGQYGVLRLYTNGRDFKARLSHVGAAYGRYAYTDVWLCGTSGGSVCFTGQVFDGGVYSKYAGDVQIGSSCVRANGRIDYGYRAEAMILFCR